jgi:hypothetical protein
MLSLQSLQPILNMVAVVGSIAGQSLKLPDVSQISAQADPGQSIASLSQAVDTLKQVINSLPG